MTLSYTFRHQRSAISLFPFLQLKSRTELYQRLNSFLLWLLLCKVLIMRSWTMWSAVSTMNRPLKYPKTGAGSGLETALVNRDAERIPLSVSQREKLDKKYDYYGASGVIDKVDRYLFDKPLLLVGEDGATFLLRSKPIAFIASGQILGKIIMPMSLTPLQALIYAI